MDVKAGPVVGYIGGKRALARRIIPMIEAIDHTTYAEPFVGMGGIFLRRETQAKAEVINDRSGDVATFFRILQRHYAAFLDMLRFQLTTRREFERLIKTDPTTLTDLERSARFLYLQATAFGGKVAGRTFGVSPGRGGAFNVTRLGPRLEALHERLAGVVIECLDWQPFIRRYDRPDTLFYLDPPYFGCEGDYGRELFDPSEFEVMAEVLKGLRGRFILSLNDHPEVRRIFAGLNMIEADVRYSLNPQREGKPAARELIITG